MVEPFQAQRVTSHFAEIGGRVTRRPDHARPLDNVDGISVKRWGARRALLERAIVREPLDAQVELQEGVEVDVPPLRRGDVYTFTEDTLAGASAPLLPEVREEAERVVIDIGGQRFHVRGGQVYH